MFQQVKVIRGSAGQGTVEVGQRNASALQAEIMNSHSSSSPSRKAFSLALDLWTFVNLNQLFQRSLAPVNISSVHFLRQLPVTLGFLCDPSGKSLQDKG